ncbi:hypothetical protein [Pseudomonas syringae]|nr:hypothetical protein [Pseudomonas syringae]
MNQPLDVQFINDHTGKPAFAVLPIHQYEVLMLNHPMADDLPTPLIKDGRYIALPESDGDYIDLVRLVKHCLDQATVSMSADDDYSEKLEMYRASLPVNARTQSLERFESQFAGGLDPLIRRYFLREDSPYKNTMQATTEVVDALVKTGIFKRTKRKFDFYRPVNALDFDQDAGKAYLVGKPDVQDPIPPYYWLHRSI